MNIAQAKEEIKRTLQIYFRRDENGMYRCPPRQQRPILLIGPPGIGKTAVMEQISRECNVGLVSYTMTHHTRQSAIGLPKIVTRVYDGISTDVTEYTLSEIIASIHECMNRTGLSEGILFLDEINCVSETLSPVMLQLLQSKMFGMHQVPPGWLICAAGNPPEYNRSAHPFDIVTLDRVRCIPIEPDLACWLDYATSRNVHEAVLSYLQMRPEAFYQARSNAQQQIFVTARGWEDLSFLMQSSEQLGEPCGIDQMRQFLGDDKTAKDFSAYYRLFLSCSRDYPIPSILDGSMEAPVLASCKEQIRTASYEERYLLTGLIQSVLCREISGHYDLTDRIGRLSSLLTGLSEPSAEGCCETAEKTEPQKPADLFYRRILAEEEKIEKRKNAGLLSYEDEKRQRSVIRILQMLRERSACMHDVSDKTQEALLKEEISENDEAALQLEQKILSMTENAFAFCSDCCSQDAEMLLLVSGLARNKKAMRFLSGHECRSFLEWSARLMPS